MKNQNTIFWIVGILVVVALLVGPQLGLFSTLGNGDNWIYQEDADVTICEGDWYYGDPCTNTYDRDWDTKGYCNVYQQCFVYFNYTKPIGATSSSLWEVKDQNARLNLSINANCFAQSPLQFRVMSYPGGGSPQSHGTLPQSSWDCWDGGNWITLREGEILDYYRYQIYEEAMWWNVGGEGEDGDGNGNGDGCTSHASKKCYSSDIYYYDSCGVREEKYNECGTVGCTNGVCKTIDDDDGDNGDVNGIPTNGNGEENGEVTSFSLNQPLFKLGDFNVTILILLILIGGAFIIKIISKKIK